MPNAAIPVRSAEMQRRLEITDAQLVLYACDHRMRPEHFHPRLLAAFRARHQEFEVIYC